MTDHITIDRKVVEQVLEALGYGYDSARCAAAFDTIHNAETALRAALDAAKKAEPVAWNPGVPPMYPVDDGSYTVGITHPQPATPDGWQVTDAMVDAFIGFANETAYLHHSDVPYYGTANGDSEDQWRRRMMKAALEKALAAAPKKEGE